MKKKDLTVEEMIMKSHYLNALEQESKAEAPLSDMEREAFIETIRDLKESIRNANEMIRSLQSELDRSNRLSERYLSLITDLRSVIADLRKKLDEREKEISDLRDLNNRHNKMAFGEKSTSRRHKRPSPKTSREEEKEDCEGPGAGTPDKSGQASNRQPEETLDKTKVKSEHLDAQRGPRGPYTQMDAARKIVLESSLEGVPPDWVFDHFKDVDEYNRISYVELKRFRVAVFKDRYGVYHEYYRPLHPEIDDSMPRANVIPGTHLTPDLFADIVSDVYQLHTPVYRERIRNILDKFTVSNNTIANALKIGAGMLAPILLKLKSRLLKVKSVLNIDETWIRVRIKALNDGTKLGHYYKKYVWALVNKPENVTYFFYDNDEDDSRGSRPIETFLGGFLGSIQSDGYVVYKHLAEVNPQCEFILCWAHVRNKFAMTFEANKDADADWFVRKIGELYKIEAECILRHLKPHEIKKRRSRDDVTRILASIYERAMELLNGKRKHYGEMMRKSLSYMVGGWEKLLNYRKDGRYTIDNMLVERAIRPFTIHRKNSLFFSSEEGIETALTFLTLIETCKNVGLNARDYIATTIKLLIDGNKNYDDLVPMSMAV